jgi:hypothetical protein
MKDDTSALGPPGAIDPGKKISLNQFDSCGSISSANKRAELGGGLRRSDETSQVAEAHFKKTFQDLNANEPASPCDEDQFLLAGNPSSILLSIVIFLHRG